MGSISARNVLDDQGPKVVIVLWVLIALSFIFVVLRVFCKFQTHRALWWDDHILIISWIFQLVANGTTTAAVELGFGKHMVDVDPTNLVRFGLLNSVSATFSMLAAVLSKTSFAVTLLRITEGYTKKAVWAIIVIMNVSMWLSGLLIWIQCQPIRKSWDYNAPGTCWDLKAVTGYNVYSAAISGLGDLLLALLPWRVLFNLQIKPKEKMGVGLAMSMGIFAAATAFIKCTKIPQIANGDPTYDSAEVTIWSCAEVATTIMAACIPVLRVLLQYVKSSAKKYSSDRYGPSNGPTHVRGTRGATTVVTASRNVLRSHAGKDDDTGSDKSILSGGNNPGQIMQTSEYIVEFHDQGRAKSTNGDEDSVGGYEMTNRRAEAA